MENGELIATALAVGAAAYFRPNNWAQDRPEVEAYLALVERLTGSFQGVQARMMEEGPGSEQRRALLAEQVTKSGAAENRGVLRLSRRVLELVAERAPHSLAAALIDQDVVRQALLGGREPVTAHAA